MLKRWIPLAIAGSVVGTAALEPAQVGLIRINGAIGPATANYVARAIDAAAEQHDQCLIIELDTPGGLLESTKEIVQTFYASKVPVGRLRVAVRSERGQRRRFHHLGGGYRCNGAEYDHRRGASG